MRKDIFVFPLFIFLSVATIFVIPVLLEATGATDTNQLTFFESSVLAQNGGSPEFDTLSTFIPVPQYGNVFINGDEIRVVCLDRSPREQGEIRMTNRVPVGTSETIGTPLANCTLTYEGNNIFRVTVGPNEPDGGFTSQTFVVG